MKRRHTNLVIPSGIVGLAVLVTTVASALTVAAIGLDRLTAESDLIIHCRAVSSHAQWEDQNIYTYTTVQVLETLKGNAAGEVTVKQAGGTVDDITAVIDGAPVLRDGEELVLFLREWEGNYWIHSIVLGKFSVLRNGPAPVALSDLNNVGLMDPVTGKEITDPASKLNAVDLAAFFRDIRTITQQ